MEECRKVVNNEGFVVDTCTGEVIDEDYRFTYERFDNLVPITTTKVENTDEKKFRQYMRIANHKGHEYNIVKDILTSRIEDERIREDFVKLAEEARRHGIAGLIAAYAIAHYMNGVSIRTKDLREEFGIGDYKYRETRKWLQTKLGKKDIHALVFRRLKELKGYDFEELKQIYYQLLSQGKLSGKNVKSRVEMVLKVADSKLGSSRRI